MNDGIKDLVTIVVGYAVSLATLTSVQDILGIIVAFLTSIYLVVMIIIKLKKCFKK